MPGDVKMKLAGAVGVEGGWGSVLAQILTGRSAQIPNRTIVILKRSRQTSPAELGE